MTCPDQSKHVLLCKAAAGVNCVTDFVRQEDIGV